MEGGNLGTNSRPVRSSSRYFTYGPHSSSPGNFSGPVRRWEKKWVHVSPSQPSTKNNSRSKPLQSNVHKSPTSPILLCKWTPLPPSASVDGGRVELPRRKLRYTPIAVVKEHKKLPAKRAADQDFAEKPHLSEERPEIDSDDSSGMLDINTDLRETDQGTSKSRSVSQYSRRS